MLRFVLIKTNIGKNETFLLIETQLADDDDIRKFYGFDRKE